MISLIFLSCDQWLLFNNGVLIALWFLSNLPLGCSVHIPFDHSIPDLLRFYSTFFMLLITHLSSILLIVSCVLFACSLSLLFLLSSSLSNLSFIFSIFCSLENLFVNRQSSLLFHLHLHQWILPLISLPMRRPEESKDIQLINSLLQRLQLLQRMRWGKIAS